MFYVLDTRVSFLSIARSSYYRWFITGGLSQVIYHILLKVCIAKVGYLKTILISISDIATIRRSLRTRLGIFTR